MPKFKKGDRVRWNSPEGEITGKIVAHHESDFEFMGQTRRATSADPQYEVESAKTGARAAHKESALSKAD